MDSPEMPVQRQTIRRSLRISNQGRRNYSENADESTTPSLGAEELVATYFPFMNPGLSHPSGSLPIRNLPSTLPTNKQHTSHSHCKPEGHISRPPNAFMLFRSDFWATEKKKDKPIERDHRCISRIVAHCWKNVDSGTKARYEELAKHLRKQHRDRYPDYKFRPISRGAKQVKKPKKNKVEEEQRCRELAFLVMGSTLRSTSPTVADSSHPSGSVECDSYDPCIPRTSDDDDGQISRYPDITHESVYLAQEAEQPHTVQENATEDSIQSPLSSAQIALSSQHKLQALNFFSTIQHPLYEAIDTPFAVRPDLTLSEDLDDIWYTSNSFMRENDTPLSHYPPSHGLDIDFLSSELGSLFNGSPEVDFLRNVAAVDLDNGVDLEANKPAYRSF